MDRLYNLVITNPSEGTERASPYFPSKNFFIMKHLAEWIYDWTADDEAIEVKNDQGDTIYIIAPCYQHGCKATVHIHTKVQWGNLEGDKCAHCEEVFCADHLWDTDDHGDDGSGQYVSLLDDFYCQSCIDARRQRPEYD